MTTAIENPREFQSERALYLDGDRIRALHEIATELELGSDGQFREALRLATESLGMEIGIISFIEHDSYTIEYHHAASAGLENGQTFPLGQTYCCLTLAHGAVVAIDHMKESEHSGHPCYQAFPLEAYIGDTIRIDSSIYGTVSFSSARRRHRPWSSEDKDFVRMISKWVGVTLKRMHAERALRLARFTIDRAPDAVFWMGPDARLINVNDHACRVLGYTREELLSMSVQDFDPNFAADDWPQVWEEVKERGRLTVESVHRTKDGRTVPVEVIANHFVFDGKEYNCAFARDITERKRTQRKLERMARHDHLTDLLNRRALTERLSEAVQATSRYGSPLSLLLIDMDHFKRINDTYGHPVGDQALVGLSRLLRKQARVTDHVGRFGGEEFCLVTYETAADGALTLAERLRQAMSSAVVVPEVPDLRVTCSIGVAQWQGGQDSLEGLLRRADQALYHAKRNGRNRISTWADARDAPQG